MNLEEALCDQIDETKRLKERLEKCEAAIQANLESHGRCICSSCERNRAALEGR